jgi:hypothetical protein
VIKSSILADWKQRRMEGFERNPLGATYVQAIRHDERFFSAQAENKVMRWREMATVGLTLIDEVANISEDTITQIHTEQPRAQSGTKFLLKSLKDGRREVGLFPEQLQQGRAVGWVFIVAWQPASGPDRQREGNRTHARIDAIGRLSNEIDSHAEA